MATEVWLRIRGINSKADIVPAVRGQVDAAALIDVGGFDLARMAAEDEQEPDHAHSHGHEHGHTHAHGHAHGHDEDEHGHGHDDGMAPEEPVTHAHDHSSAAKAAAHHHNRHVGTFSLVRDGVAVEPLLFARWIRKVASAKKEDVGTLYRSKVRTRVTGCRCHCSGVP